MLKGHRFEFHLRIEIVFLLTYGTTVQVFLKTILQTLYYRLILKMKMSKTYKAKMKCRNSMSKT